MKLRVYLMTALLSALGISAMAGPIDKTLDIYWVDVEGGGATLMVTPMGESVLIDTGNPGGRDPKRIFKVASEVAGLKKIDHLVITHMHGDHFGGAAELSQMIPIGMVHDNGIPERDPDGGKDSSFLLKIRPYREMNAEGRSVINPGEVLPLKAPGYAGAPKLALRCLCARQQTVPPRPNEIFTNPLCEGGKEKAPDTSDNANSIVLLLQFGSFRFFDGGVI